MLSPKNLGTRLIGSSRNFVGKLSFDRVCWKKSMALSNKMQFNGDKCRVLHLEMSDALTDLQYKCSGTRKVLVNHRLKEGVSSAPS